MYTAYRSLSSVGAYYTIASTGISIIASPRFGLLCYCCASTLETMVVRIITICALLAPSYAAVCTGKSVDLPPKECAAWQDFFLALDGPNWRNFGSDGLTDPCAVKSKIGNPCKGGPTSGAAVARRLEQRHAIYASASEGGAAGTPPWQEPDAGVCCQRNAAGELHITQLAFAINGLQGEIPPSIIDMEELNNLSCCSNAINGTVPQLPASIQFLRMSSNKLTGIHPSLPSNTALTFLSLRDCAIEGGLPDFTALKKLTDLYMDCNKLSGAVPAAYGSFRAGHKCFISASTLLESCGNSWDNAFSCPLPDNVAKECHAVCKT